MKRGWGFLCICILYVFLSLHQLWYKARVSLNFIWILEVVYDDSRGESYRLQTDYSCQPKLTILVKKSLRVVMEMLRDLPIVVMIY